VSGSSIGGIVGGAIGFVVTGGNPIGAQVGFMLGSAIGGYIDPVKVTGPRLSDAMAQTSTVGGVIPFGHGVYVTAGNIIWRDVLKEHKKTERGGKGGGQKTTTYTYTRSYAVGVCQGPIYGFHWIKRNGKKVYTTSPTATADERTYSAKWLRKATLYLGNEAQMPDSTIVAVEGVGNVSPNRGLAYIVVENDDLTDMQGAIPQYEFCVRASPPEAYLTSHVYPQHAGERAGMGVQLGLGVLRDLVEDSSVTESSTVGISFQVAQLRQPQAFATADDQSAMDVTFPIATLREPKVVLPPSEEAAASAVSFPTATKRIALVAHKQPAEKASASISLPQATLYVP